MDIAAVFGEVAMETVTHEKVIEGEHGSCSTLCEKGNRKREIQCERERFKTRQRKMKKEDVRFSHGFLLHSQRECWVVSCENSL